MFGLTISEGILPLSQGFLLYAGLIIAMGPQNLFVLRQGLRRRHLFAIALLCTLADLVLTSLSVGGLGTFISESPGLSAIATFGGVLFLTGCGVRSLGAAWRNRLPNFSEHGDSLPVSRKTTAVAVLGFAFLNPGTYVDTLLVVGTASGQYATDERLIFGTGAVLASAFLFVESLAPTLPHGQVCEIVPNIDIGKY